MTGFSRAAICSPLTLASEVGRDVLRDGGNAVDAAIATNLTLAVAYPHMCGVGGDLLAMVWSGGKLSGLNSSGALPARATLPPDGVPQRGVGSATVPGAPAGWRALAERFGSKPLEELAATAARFAREGIDRSPGLAKITGWSRQILGSDPDAARIFLDGERLVQPELADVLDDLENFYEGAVAHAAPAPFTPEDFSAHRVEWVTPLRAPLAGVDVCEMPPSSRGHLTLEAIRRLEPLDGLNPSDPEWHRRLIAAVQPAVSGGDTVYLCVVDQDRLAVSINQSLFRAFGSGVVVPGTGVLLHNRGAYHSVETYRGGAKPVHTLSPAMGLTDEQPRIVFGTMGGDAQIQIHLQLLARILVAREPVEEAIAAPRWQLTGATLLVEEGLPPLDGVVPRVSVEPMPTAELAGHAHAILLEGDGLHAAADPRSDGIPVGI